MPFPSTHPAEHHDDRLNIRILDILKEKGKTKYWLYIRLGLSYQNFNNLVMNRTKSIKFSVMRDLCEILECTPNDLFEEYVIREDNRDK